jgi:hypothetical protein
MKISEQCLKHGEDCERTAAACGPGSSRDSPLNTAAQWRRLAEAAASDEAVLGTGREDFKARLGGAGGALRDTDD